MFLPNFKEISYDRWLERAVGGLWISDRRYLYYGKNGGKTDVKSIELQTEFSVARAHYGSYAVTWDGRTSGTMVLTLEDDVLHRDIGYFSNEPTDSLLERVDHDTVVFRTTYGGSTYREEVRYVEDDLRLRQTVGWDEVSGRLQLAGQYVERRS